MSRPGGRTGTDKKSPGRLWAWLSGLSERVPSWSSCTLTLQYDGGGTDRLTLCTYPCASLPRDEEVAHELIETAQGDCDARGTRTQYVVQVTSIRDESVSMVHGTHILRLKPQDLTAIESQDAPDARGLLAQCMRHLEISMQLNARMLIQQQTAMSGILESQSKILEAISNRAAKAESELAERPNADVSDREERLLEMAERLLPELLK